ncbi:MAG: hypothetical protein ACSHWU_02005 [Marinicella sp.]
MAKFSSAMFLGQPKLEVLRITRLYGYASSNHFLDSETGLPGVKFPFYLEPGKYLFEVRCTNFNTNTVVYFYEWPEVRVDVVENGEYIIDCDIDYCTVELMVTDIVD